MKGTPSIDMMKSGSHGLIFSVSWNVEYSYTNNNTPYKTSSFIPHTFGRLVDRSNGPFKKYDPLEFFSDYEMPWIKEDNDLLSVCMKVKGDKDNHFLKLSHNNKIWLTQYRCGPVDIQKNVETWEDFVKATVKYALAHQQLSFDCFEKLSPKNKLFVLNILHATNIRNDETIQIFKSELNMELEQSLATKSVYKSSKAL